MCTHSIIHIPFQLLVLLPIAPLGAPRAGSRAGACSRAGTRTGAPHLDAGSNKLSGTIKDHVNPASWSGNTNPATVNLGVQWNVGAALAGQALTADGVYTAEEVNYAQIATTSDATMLQPRGVAGGRPGVCTSIAARTEYGY